MLAQRKRLELLSSKGAYTDYPNDVLIRRNPNYFYQLGKEAKKWENFVYHQRIPVRSVTFSSKGFSVNMTLVTRKDFLQACKNAGMTPLYATKDIPPVFVITTNYCLIPSFSMSNRDYFIHGYWGFIVPLSPSEFVREFYDRSLHREELMDLLHEFERIEKIQ